MDRSRLLIVCVAFCGCTSGEGIVNITVPSSVQQQQPAPADLSVATIVERGITVTPKTGLSTTTGGAHATFRVVLDSQPTGDVHIALLNSDPTQATVSAASLTFDFADWNVPQTVTVTGLDDKMNGDHAYTITLKPASSDAEYNALAPIVVSLVNIDTDVPGFVVSPTSGLSVTPGGPNATFNVRLTTPPTANVTTAITSSNTTLGTVSPASLTFTPVNWATAQPVSVTGVDDQIAGGNQMFNIVLAAATSTDTNYAGLDPADVSVTNVDVDVAGVTVVPTAGLTTTKAGGTATFTVKLHSKPVANVSIAVTSSDVTKGTVSGSSGLPLVFTPASWSTTQTVTITGVNDNKVTGDTMYTINLAKPTGDTVYSTLGASTVSVTSSDTNIANILLSRTSGLQTVECGTGCQPHVPAYGTDTFTVKLSTQPTANVTIGISSDNTGKGSVSGSSGLPLVFTTANWNTAQTVTVTGVENTTVDNPPNVVYHVVTAAATSTDSSYNGMNPSDVSVTSIDDDVYIYAGGPDAGTDANMEWCTTSTNCANGLVVNMPYRGGTADFVVWIAGAPHGVYSNNCGGTPSGAGELCSCPSPEFPAEPDLLSVKPTSYAVTLGAGTHPFACTVHCSAMYGSFIVP